MGTRGREQEQEQEQGEGEGKEVRMTNAVGRRQRGVEGVGIRLRFGEPGRPVTANGVSLNGENASRTRESHRR